MKILKFGAVWCPGCLVMKPRFVKIEQELPWLETEFHDFDTDKAAVKRYNITETLPAFVFLDNSGNEFMRLTGEIEKSKLITIINENKDR